MSKYDVLVIDDEKVILDSIVKVGKVENLEIDTANNGKDGLDKLRMHEYNLVVCDLILPDLNGFDVVKFITSNNIISPIIVTTGFSTIDNAIKAMQLGAIDFLPKPFTFDEILGCIRKGMRYSKIILSRVETLGKLDASPIQFIPCPPSYYRFGLSSWLNIEKSDCVKTGLTDLNMRTIDEVESLVPKQVNEEVIQGQEYLSVTCSQGIEYKILSPVSGRIIEINESIIANTKLLEKDPFFEGWIFRISPSELHNELEFLTSCSTDRL